MIKYNPTSHPEALKGRATMLRNDRIDEIEEANWDSDHKIWDIREFARAIESEVLGGSEPVGSFLIYKPILPHGKYDVTDCNMPWVYDQDPQTGFSASMRVIPYKPQQASAETYNCYQEEAGDIKWAEINRLNEVIKGYQDDQKETIGKWATDYRKQAERIAELEEHWKVACQFHADSEAQVTKLTAERDQADEFSKELADTCEIAEKRVIELEGLAEHWNIVDAANKIASLTAALELCSKALCMNPQDMLFDETAPFMAARMEALAAIKEAKGGE